MPAIRGSTIDAAEVERFAAIAPDWWNESGAFRPLHRLNPARIEYVRDRLAGHFARDIKTRAPFAGLSLLDIGCGGGLMCEPLARLGCAVTGIDADETALAVARAHATAHGLAIDYRTRAAEELASTGRRFDAVLALEVVEHAADPALFVATAASLVRPGGALVLSTLNRTPKAFAAAIVGAEYLLRWLPRGTHQYRKFRRPSELARDVRAAGLDVADLAGLVYDPWQDRWSTGKDLGINYLLFATMPK
ncbi:MAG TPA: bifunctional 2-polyprenyl-6-hydroxyphenol methylase/3-demethylubiquinol 3-O-methyltransferase UbiG [Stellaceae bacterium]|jgi:2-polyprenyl-6-hydroxyphenyl methylase/3-demethylubiquinone-9 3-methyltransferase|nr:bifunctional 2-polyprenyl-6-hydroxyphenol methylase/3-demethylubiquinol 3-O-methyltransferase UbiG [Stellaceae bacterium]